MCSQLQFEDAAAEKLLQTDVAALLSWKMEGQTTCVVQICFLQSLILLAFFFLMEPSCCVLLRGGAMVWMLLKPWWVFPNSGAPSALEQLEPLGWMSSTVSVLGLHIPSITCLCCHQSLQEKLLSWWGGNARTRAFYIPTTHSARPLWKFIWWEQHVLVLVKIHFIQLWLAMYILWFQLLNAEDEAETSEGLGFYFRTSLCFRF